MKRLAVTNDFEAVYSIYMHEAVVPYLGYDPMPKQSFLPIFLELVESKGFNVYEVEGRVAGFYKVSRYPGRCAHVAYVGTLALAPEFQGRGIAKQMMIELFDELFSGGVRRIELLVESDNAKAIQFYRTLGFEIEGTLKKFYKRADQDHYVDEYIMARVI